MIDTEKVRPARGMLLVHPLLDNVSGGGIILTDKTKRPVQKGTILQLGLPYRNKKTSALIPWGGFTVGDIVYYTWTAGTELKTDKGVMLLLLGTEVFAFEDAVVIIPRAGESLCFTS